MVWRPFLLRPDMPPAGMDLPQEFLADMADSRRRLAQVAATGGLPMVFSDHIPNSRQALEATEYAYGLGKGEEFHRAVFLELYGQGHDISRWEVLRAAAVAAGIDPDDLQARTENGAFRNTVESKAGEAHEIGIHAVPTFVISGKVRIVGVQPYETFAQAIAQTAAAAGS